MTNLAIASTRAFPLRLRQGRVVLCAFTCALTPACSLAGSIGGSVAATTDYVYRGLSQTRGKSALQADVHYKPDAAWTVGAWASTVDPNPGSGATVELDLYASRNWVMGQDWDARLSVTHYTYLSDKRASSYDYDEITGSLIYQSRLAATIAWSPEAPRYSNGWVVRGETATSYELTGTQPLFRTLSATAGAGYYDLSNLFNIGYWFWNAGLTWSAGGAQVAISYMDTDDTAVRAFGDDSAGSRWTGMLIWRF